ncbi:hypothetical protein OC861_005986 [Tilletia horrida]|nr:hypothetical protein OC861_005986 [Tilletia horrida]
MAVSELGNTTSPGWDTVATEDETVAWGSAEELYQYDALVFISTTGDVLSPAAIELTKQYMRDGGSLVGVHAAADCVRSAPWFGRAMGAFFRCHPNITDATLNVGDATHPSVSFLTNGTWDVYDEIFTYNSNPRLLNHTVVLSIQDGSYPDDQTSNELKAQLMGTPHPLSWYKDGSSSPGDGLLDSPYQPIGGGVDDDPSNSSMSIGSGGPGRSWYTGLGHTIETYSDPTFRQHLTGGIQWVLESKLLRSRTGNCSSPGQPLDD